MEEEMRKKITAEHLGRSAYVYVRQSSGGSTIPEGRERTDAQYGLKDRLLALGWDEEQVITIDGDVGRPGVSSHRGGFRRLVGEVRRGRAGVVAALDITRLTRDPHAGLELMHVCATAGTLLLVDDQLWDPSILDDRLWLGVKLASFAEAICRRRRRPKYLREARGASGRSSDAGAEGPGLGKRLGGRRESRGVVS
jgi:DNA invertase Pin-like site-specific DNA recombinase